MNSQPTPTRPVEYVNLSGAVVFVPEIRKKLPAPSRRSAPDKFHKGFRVEGHPPGALERARDFAVKAREDWLALSAAEQSSQRAAGAREPKEWDEARWLAKTKLKPVRSKPYEIPAAADECAALARKAGWLGITVRQISKGEPEAG